MPSSSKLIEVALSEVGYLEKKSLKDLDSKTANAGSNNYTKYWRDMDPSMQGLPWCDCFVGWCFVTAYGKEEAKKLQCGGSYICYTPTSASLYKKVGRWSRQPEIGAQIFFENSERINHTGIVYAYTDTDVYTIEGNTAEGTSIIANGGAVCMKSYKRNNSRIAGYGVPNYTKEEPKKMTAREFIDAVSNVAQIAQKGGWTYGNSQSLPPCADHIISCDRLIARALWDKGYQEQPKGGITVLNMEQYLTKWKFKKLTKPCDVIPGDIILFKADGTSAPTPAWHTFVVTEYNAATTLCSKYDAGSQPRINTGCFSKNVPLDEWSNKTFYCAFRLPGGGITPTGTRYTIESALNNRYCLDCAGGKTEPGTNVQLHTKNGTEAQQFCAEDVKDGYVRIVNVKSGLVLDVKGGKAASKKNLQLWGWNQTPAQLWKMRRNDDETITFESALDERFVLDVSGGKAKNGTNIWLYKNNQTKAQRFKLI